jgi:hypothetical protein
MKCEWPDWHKKLEWATRPCFKEWRLHPKKLLLLCAMVEVISSSTELGKGGNKMVAGPVPVQNSEILLAYYKEHVEHGRHLETQRSAIAALGIPASGAIIGKMLEQFATDRQLGVQALPYSVTLLFIGLTCWVLSAKLYERFRLHNEVAKLARNELDPRLATLRIKAKETIQARYPLLFKTRLHIVWNLVFVAVARIGLVSTLFVFFSWHFGN